MKKVLKVTGLILAGLATIYVVLIAIVSNTEKEVDYDYYDGWDYY